MALSELKFPKLKTKTPQSAPKVPPQRAPKVPTPQPASQQPNNQQPATQQPPNQQAATQQPAAQQRATQTPAKVPQTELASIPTGQSPAPEVKQPEQAPPPPPGFIALNIQPWAEVKEIKDEKGNSATIACSVTPCKIQLPVGTYNISLYNSHYSNIVVHVDVRSNQITLVNQRMEGFDYAKVLESLGL